MYNFVKLQRKLSPGRYAGEQGSNSETFSATDSGYDGTTGTLHASRIRVHVQTPMQPDTHTRTRTHANAINTRNNRDCCSFCVFQSIDCGAFVQVERLCVVICGSTFFLGGERERERERAMSKPLVCV